jgi:hypothetical protein
VNVLRSMSHSELMLLSAPPIGAAVVRDLIVRDVHGQVVLGLCADRAPAEIRSGRAADVVDEAGVERSKLAPSEVTFCTTTSGYRDGRPVPQTMISRARSSVNSASTAVGASAGRSVNSECSGGS